MKTTFYWLQVFELEDAADLVAARSTGKTYMTDTQLQFPRRVKCVNSFQEYTACNKNSNRLNRRCSHYIPILGRAKVPADR
jgi:hypothetical protein